MLLMETHDVTEQNPSFRCSNLKHKLWLRIFGENEKHQQANKIQAAEPQCWPTK